MAIFYLAAFGSRFSSLAGFKPLIFMLEWILGAAFYYVTRDYCAPIPNKFFWLPTSATSLLLFEPTDEEIGI